MNVISDRRRPKPRSLVRIDPGNPYARLGVSPQASTEEIKRTIDERRRAAMAKRLERSAEKFGEEEAEMTRLQELEKQIGSPRARAVYDEDHPLTELLTVQRGPRDHFFDAADPGGLVTSWLIGELGQEVLLPSPESLALWAPRGLDPTLFAELAPFTQNTTPKAEDFVNETTKEEHQDG